MATMYGARTVVKVAALAGSLAFTACGSEVDVTTARADTAAEIRASSACTQPLPSDIAAPSGTDLEIEMTAVGVQVYTCTAKAGGASWVFTGPEANLYNQRGMFAGTHYAGPTWESTDGSTVVAARISGVTIDPTAIPWLLLGAVSHDGQGEMRRITHVQRVATTGGTMPTTGCNAETIGAIERVPYTATYCFHDKQ